MDYMNQDDPFAGGFAPYDPYAPKKKAVGSAYTTYLGRDLTDPEFEKYWKTMNGDFESSIKNSPEAQAYAKSKTATSPASGTYSRDAMMNILRQVNPKDWEHDLKNYDAQLRAMGVTPQMGENGTLYRGRMITPDGPIDPFNELGWGPASYDPGPQAANAGYTAATSGRERDPQVGEAIQKLLARGFSTPTADDPAIAAQFAPQKLAITRGAQRTRQAAAERAAQEGSMGGAFDADVNAINEKAGETKQSALGGIIGNEIAGRRADVNSALGAAQGEERMGLDQILAEMSDATSRLGLGNQRYGMDLQNQQFYDNFSRLLSNDANNSNDALLQYIMSQL